jgi:hypothetical protein
LLEKIQSATKNFVVINGRKLSPTLRMLNEQHSSIKFTSEEEDNGSLPFLDVKVKLNQKIQKLSLKMSGITITLV